MQEVVGYEIDVNDLFNSAPKTEDSVEYDNPSTAEKDEEGIYAYITDFSKPTVFLKAYYRILLAVLFLACLVAIAFIVFLVVPATVHHTEITSTVKTTVTSSVDIKTTYHPTAQCQTTTFASPINLDRQCGNDTTNLWLDVVVAVDNSHGMTNDGLQEVAAIITSVFRSTRIGINYTTPRTTRVGVVTYNDETTVNADLNRFQSYDDFAKGISQDLHTSSQSEQSYLSIGLQAAEQLLNFQSFNTIRSHYKKVVIVYASTYQRTQDLDSVPVANRLTEDGVYIITVAYDRGGDEKMLYKLAEIATPGMAYNTTGSGSPALVHNIQQSLLQANCYCPDGWEQYRTSFSSRFSYHYGQCLKAFTIPATWNDSRMICRNQMTNSYLATETSPAKHNFILDYVKNQEGMDTLYKYNIGLSWSTIENWWIWEQPAGMTPVPNGPPVYNGAYTNWGAGWPIVGSPMIGVQNVQSGTQSCWQNILQSTGSSPYVCEVYSCDTDNYCDGDN